MYFIATEKNYLPVVISSYSNALFEQSFSDNYHLLLSVLIYPLGCMSKSDESTTPCLKGSRDSPKVDNYNHLFYFLIITLC